MRAIFVRLFGPNERRKRAERLLQAISDQARRPAFYERLGVPDSLDGRFDLMSLHGLLVFRALQGKGREGAELAQTTTDLMFEAFDDALRSLGVGDSGIPRRVKTMGKAYLGRAAAYAAALDAGDEAGLRDALARNLYRGAPPEGDPLAWMSVYVLRQATRLSALPLQPFADGVLGFEEP